jgi:hypothetical protein
VHRLADVDRTAVQLDLVGLDPGDVEQVIDQLDRAIGGARGDLASRLTLAIRVEAGSVTIRPSARCSIVAASRTGSRSARRAERIRPAINVSPATTAMMIRRRLTGSCGIVSAPGANPAG